MQIEKKKKIILHLKNLDIENFVTEISSFFILIPTIFNYKLFRYFVISINKRKVKAIKKL